MSREFSFTAKEESISCHGLDFLCLYGKHINGGFVAIINWGVAAELSAYNNSLRYNTDKILSALERSPDIGWLPQDADARRAVARDLAQMLGERMSLLSEPPR